MTRTIRARIHESAVKRVTRIYAATAAEVLAEILQNSRRAGATRVRVTIAAPAAQPADAAAGETPLIVTIADDGDGIADPAVLLSFGENGWDDALVRREDAAGFGFASLARRGCTVSSRPRSPGGQILPGWRVELVPGHFLGEVEAEVFPDDAAPYPHGTSISFQATESAAAIRNAAENAARPLPAAGRVRGPHGGRIRRRGTAAPRLPRRRRPCRAMAGPRLRRLQEPPYRLQRSRPQLLRPHPGGAPAHGRDRSRRDLDRSGRRGDCPDLELVLPARKEPVENDFLTEMREAARIAIYRAMAADPEPRPSFEDWTRAREAGIEIAPPPAMLRPWRPSVADVEDWRDPPKLADAGYDSLVMAFDPEPPDAQALWRAAERDGFAPRLFEADRRLDGYGWYDALDRGAAMTVRAAAGGEWMDIPDWPRPEPARPGAARLPARPAAIRIELTVRPASGHPGTLDIPADVAFAGEAWCYVDDALPLVTVDSALQPHQLAELLRAGFFSPSDDADSDSWETQRDRFDEQALHLATRLLLDDDEACRVSIAEAVRRELIWLCPRGRTVEIRVSRPDVAVTLAEAGQAP